MQIFKIRKIFYILFVVCALLRAGESEMLAIRRIATSYQEEDAALAKQLGEKFEEDYPKSPNLSRIRLLLGEIALHQEQYEGALAYFNKVLDPSVATKARLSELTCYYLLKEYSTLKSKASHLLSQSGAYSPKDKNQLIFYFSEALLRQDSPTISQLDQAARYYTELLKTPLGAHAKLSLAYLSLLKEEHAAASKLYAECADLFPMERENLLYLAASLQSQYNPELAKRTFYSLKEMEGDKKEDALHSWLTLLFNTQNYEEIIAAKDEIFSATSKEKLNEARFIVGQSYLALENYDEALGFMEQYLQDGEKRETGQALFFACLCCYHLNKYDLFQSLLKTYTPSWPFQPKITFLQGKLLMKRESFSEASALFTSLIEGAEASIASKALFERALCSYSEQNYSTAHKDLRKYLDTYPEGDEHNRALYFLLQSSSKLLQAQDSSSLKAQLLQDYLLALSSESFLQEEQAAEVSLKVAKLYLDLGRLDELQSFLDAEIEKGPNSSQLYHIYLLKAAGYQNENLEAYIRCIDKALACTDNPQERSNLYLHRFWALSNKAREAEKQNQPPRELILGAARALYQAFELGHTLPVDHLLWLSHYFFQRGIQGETPDLLTAKEVFNELEAKPGSLSPKILNQIEFNQSQIFEKLCDYPSQITKLEALQKSLKRRDPLFSQVLISLAQSYEKTDQALLSKLTYEKLLKETKTVDPSKLRSAKFACSRLLITRGLGSKEQILSLLKSIKRDISWQEEPLFLKSCFSLALFSSMETLKKGDPLPYLNELKETLSFVTDNDSISMKEYHEMRLKDPQKNELYKQYLELLSAKIDHIEGRLKKDVSLTKRAEQTLLGLKKQKASGSLGQQVELELNALRAQNISDIHWLDYFIIEEEE